MVAGIREEFSKYCQGCKLTYTDVTIADVATKIQPQVQAALTADPGMNYVIALYDSAEVPFVAAAIRAAGRTGRVKVSTFNGTPEILKMVKQGDIVSAERRREPRMDRLRDRRPVDADHGRPQAGEERARAGARLRQVEHRPGRPDSSRRPGSGRPDVRRRLPRSSGACRVARRNPRAVPQRPPAARAPQAVEELRRDARPSRRRPERAPRGGPRPPRGERLGQVDADQGPRRLPRPGRRRAADRRRAGARCRSRPGSSASSA